MKIQNTSSPSSVRFKLAQDTKQGIASLISLDSSSQHSTDYTDYTDSTESSTDSSTSSRRVRFLPIVRAKDTISRHDMTEDEITRCFIQGDEYNFIWEQNERLLRRAKKYHSSGEPLPSELPRKLKGFEDDIEEKEDGLFLCTRGLESRARRYRQESIKMVLEEQELQYLEGVYDDELIADVYAEANEKCRFKAVCLAMEDRLSVCETRSEFLSSLQLQSL